MTQTRPEDSNARTYSDRLLTPETIDIVDTIVSQSDLRLRRRGLADLHMHTTYSDGTGTVEEVLEFAEKHTSLDVVAITDHDTIEGALRACDLAAAHPYRFHIIVGEEISTREGHLLGLFLQQPVAPGQSIERSIEEIHAQGGLAVVAHPFNPVFRFSVQRSVMNRLLAQPDSHPDGIETLNGSFAGIGSSQVAMALARRVYHWAETGSSDAHTPTAVGCARTIFWGESAEDLRASILSCETAPIGTFWRTREYIAYVSHRIRTRSLAANERTEPERAGQAPRRTRVARTA